MQYFGEKLSAVQLHVAGWMGSMRHSVQGALDLVWGTSRETKEEEEEEGSRDRGGGRFQRAMTPLRSIARHSRRSLHRFSVRSRQALQRRATGTNKVNQEILLNNDFFTFLVIRPNFIVRYVKRSVSCCITDFTVHCMLLGCFCRPGIQTRTFQLSCSLKFPRLFVFKHNSH